MDDVKFMLFARLLMLVCLSLISSCSLFPYKEGYAYVYNPLQPLSLSEYSSIGFIYSTSRSPRLRVNSDTPLQIDAVGSASAKFITPNEFETLTAVALAKRLELQVQTISISPINFEKVPSKKLEGYKIELTKHSKDRVASAVNQYDVDLIIMLGDMIDIKCRFNCRKTNITVRPVSSTNQADAMSNITISGMLKILDAKTYMTLSECFFSVDSYSGKDTNQYASATRDGHFPNWQHFLAHKAADAISEKCFR